MNQKPIFLFGAHKSGTSLLRNIFNGHSQLFTMPIETHFFQNMHFWVDNEYRTERSRKLNREQLIERFCKAIHRHNTSKDIYSDSISEGIFDEKLFRNKFSEIKENDPLKTLLEKYFSAIHLSTTNAELPENVRVVEKSVEHAEFASDLQAMYPDASFMHIVRNPYSNIVSMRRFKSKTYGFPIMSRILKTLYNSYYFLYRNQRLIRRYLVIRYEDLIQNPESMIKKLCTFIDIPFEDILLQPTYRGEKWSGNSTRDYAYSKIESSQMNAWQSEILPMEIRYINKLFPFVLQDYGYEKVESNGSFYKRGKGESFKRYCANRLYNIFLRDFRNIEETSSR